MSTTRQPAKKFDKIKELLHLPLPKFREHYYLSKNLAIDETMVGFRGRFGAKQYAPEKKKQSNGAW